jgi:hypothetical protein
LYQDNRTYFLDGGNGETLKMITGNTPIDALDAIPDIVGDFSMELVVGGRNGGVVCLSGGYDSTLIAVPGITGRPGLFVNAYPNPCSDILHVEVNLKQTSDVNISLSGITGKTACVFEQKRLIAGRHVFDLEPQRFNDQTHGGMYILTVTTTGGVQHLKVVIR